MSESAVLKTKFGNAQLKNGYYVISSCKEGNHNKFLHIDMEKAKQTLNGTDYNLKELA